MLLVVVVMEQKLLCAKIPKKLEGLHRENIGNLIFITVWQPWVNMLATDQPASGL